MATPHPTTTVGQTPMATPHPTTTVGQTPMATPHPTTTVGQTPMATHDELLKSVDRHLLISSDRSPQQEKVQHFDGEHNVHIHVDIDESTYRPPYDQSNKQDSHETASLDHRDPLSTYLRGKFPCRLCRENEAAINSHVVSKSVLNYLCKWKNNTLSASTAEQADHEVSEQKKLDGKEQRRYMFRTDIEEGRSVSAQECTTIHKRFLCSPCEKRFDDLDDCAYKYWRKLKHNWVSGKCKHISIEGKDMTEIVLFSFMIRAAGISLRLKWEIAYKSLEEAKCTFLKDTDKDFKVTVEELRDFGFVYCYLNHDKKYRIEFPVFCTFQLKERKMKAICMQVPPFFFLLPVLEESETAENCSQVKLLLTKYLPDIAHAVQKKLQELLDQFVEQQQQNHDSKDKRKSGLAHRFHLWYHSSNYHQTQSSPLLIFDYIDDGLNQLDIELNIY